MATPAQNISILNDFYLQPRAPLDLTAYTRAQTARRAMADLVQSASWDQAARRALAEAELLENALTLGPDREFDVRVGLLADREDAGVRKVLLDGIYDASRGFWFQPGDPSGITRWLGSSEGGRDSVFIALLSDPSPEVRAALLKLIIDAGMPAAWFPKLLQERVFERLNVQIRESGWTTSQRKALSELAARAMARASAEVAKAANSPLPTFPTGGGGEGVPTALAPARASRWAWLGALGGLLGGAVFAARR